MGETYYNDTDPFAAEWLRGLQAAGRIAAGVVDERSIEEVQPADLAGFTRCHFFAGIGGWDLALQLAGWPADRPVWTGSCPCQPFSAAGKRKGHGDSRHLWPAWFRLIRECRPPIIFGEQVASRYGLAWYDHVCADLEAEGYAIGAADLTAAGAGSPQIRQRLFFVACAERGATERQRLNVAGEARGGEGAARERERLRPDAGADGIAPDVGRSTSDRLEGQLAAGPAPWAVVGADGGAVGLDRSPGPRRKWRECAQAGEQEATQPDGRVLSPWDAIRFVECTDTDPRTGECRWRPVPAESALFPLAPGLPGRVGLLRGAGNSIVPQVAARFIRAAWGMIR